MKKINPVAKELVTNPRFKNKRLDDKKKYDRKRLSKELAQGIELAYKEWENRGGVELNPRLK